MFTTPLYWSLSNKFLGDRLFSYNGYLRFTTWSEGHSDGVVESKAISNVGLNDIKSRFTDLFPLVQLVGNYRIVLEHYPRKLSASGRYEVRLTEDQWVMHGSRLPVTRDVMIVALQQVQQILIRSTDALGATRSTLDGVTLDVAQPIHIGSFPVYSSSFGQESSTRADIAITENMSGSWSMMNRKPAKGIEKCECPPKYKSASCQDPGSGYFRWYKVHPKEPTKAILIY